MRLDVRDDAHRPLVCGTGIRVFLDGVEIDQVVMADEERREILRNRTDERGRLMLNLERTDVERETLHGTVRIELPAHIEGPIRQIEEARRAASPR